MPTVYARTLSRAVESVGSAEALARQLGVDVRYLRVWLRGTGTPPLNVFLDAVDIVMERSTVTPPPSAPSASAGEGTPTDT